MYKAQIERTTDFSIKYMQNDRFNYNFHISCIPVEIVLKWAVLCIFDTKSSRSIIVCFIGQLLKTYSNTRLHSTWASDLLYIRSTVHVNIVLFGKVHVLEIYFIDVKSLCFKHTWLEVLIHLSKIDGRIISEWYETPVLSSDWRWLSTNR